MRTYKSAVFEITVNLTKWLRNCRRTLDLRVTFYVFWTLRILHVCFFFSRIHRNARMLRPDPATDCIFIRRSLLRAYNFWRGNYNFAGIIPWKLNQLSLGNANMKADHIPSYVAYIKNYRRCCWNAGERFRTFVSYYVSLLSGAWLKIRVSWE